MSTAFASTIRAVSTVLFVSGATPQRFEKALASDADLVCIDLEDSVPNEAKAQAREAALQAIHNPRAAIRINGLATRAGIEDLLALSGLQKGAIAFIPMVESADELRIAAAILGDTFALVPLIETPRGLRKALDIASAPAVAAMMFGGGDLAASLGVELAWEPLAGARSAFLLACAEARVPAIDVPFVGLDDAAGLADECTRAAAAGFQAKAAIHPAQLATLSAAFRPDAALVAEAEAARAAFDAANGAATRFNGRMLEEPLMRRYDRILAQAKRMASDA